MLHFPKGFRVPKAYRHPHFLLLPTTPSQAVVEFVAILRERYEIHADPGPDMLQHDGQEGGVVIRGHVELTVGTESRVLGPGDAYYFDSQQPHRFRNVGDEICEVVSASSPPTF